MHPPYPQQPGPPPRYGRPPAAGECQICGSTPAANVAVPSMIGLLIAFQVRTQKGWFCRDCGLAVYREQTARTLVGGWWSITGLFVVPLVLLINLARWAKLERLAPPRPTYGVSAPNPRPLSPGRPLFQRPAALMLLMALPAVAVFLFCAYGFLTN